MKALLSRWIRVLGRMWGVLCAGWGSVLAESWSLQFPTENRSLLAGGGPAFYMHTNRTFEGRKSQPWEGGKYGFVRNPERVSGKLVYGRFHEGLDIRPLRRDAVGRPLDEVEAMAAGRVVHVNTAASKSSYGVYVVVEHELAEGRVYSLYAHLAKAMVQRGRVVKQGGVVGLLGYTGVGLDRARAHLHVELNLLLSHDFEKWHARYYDDANHHGLFNGLNLAGVDLANLLVRHARGEFRGVESLVTGMSPVWRVAHPAKNRPFVGGAYRWLGSGNPVRSESGWELTLSASGVPLKLRPAKRGVRGIHGAQVVWVAELGMDLRLRSKGRLSGRGAGVRLTSSGKKYVDLLFRDE